MPWSVGRPTAPSFPKIVLGKHSHTGAVGASPLPRFLGSRTPRIALGVPAVECLSGRWNAASRLESLCYRDPVVVRTPAALVDLEVVRRNVARMTERSRRLGVALRPHVKTHKCVELARLQTEGQPGGITVSTLAEARAFAAAGLVDITYAVPVAPAKLEELLALARAGARVGVLVEHAEALEAVERAGASAGLRMPVWLEVDSGAHRTGVDPSTAEAMELATRVASSRRVAFEGILTHAGQAYACRDRDGALLVARHERGVMVSFAHALAAFGVEVRAVSVGSTPTVAAVDHLEGVTEIRPGNYVFHDAFQVAIGTCHVEDCAFSVLASVIACHPKGGRVVLDAGALALSRDPGPVHVDPACGFGIVVPLGEMPPDTRLRVVSLTQEHGVVRVEPAAAAAWLPIGSRVRVIPNHSCLAAACFDRYTVVSGGVAVDEWRPARGW